MRKFAIPDRFLSFEVSVTYMPEHRHIDVLINIPAKKIYLNRAADETANVVQVQFSRNTGQRE